MVSLVEIFFTEEGYFCIVCLAYLKTHIPGEHLALKCILFLFVDKVLLLHHPHPLTDPISILPSGTNPDKFLESLLQVISHAQMLFYVR